MSKEQINEKAEGIVDRFLASDLVAKVVILTKTARTLVLIVVPLALAYYLVDTQGDRLVVALGYAIAIVGVVNLVKTAYRAETKPTKRK